MTFSERISPQLLGMKRLYVDLLFYSYASLAHLVLAFGFCSNWRWMAVFVAKVLESIPVTKPFVVACIASTAVQE